MAEIVDLDERRGRGRPSKTLEELVRVRSFKRRKHGKLLDAPQRLPWPELQSIYLRRRRATRDDTRERLELEFERAVRELDAAGYEYDPPEGDLQQILAELGPPGSAERAIAFFPRFFKHRKGVRRGERFELDEFQKEFLREFFRRRRDGRRVYQRGYLIIPGGNGKSPLAAGLGILALAELEDAPEIYVIAGAKGQAGIVQGFARSFVNGTNDDPGELRQWLRASGSSIANPRTEGVMETLPSSGGLQEGKEPSVVIVDELWAFTTAPQEATYVAMSGKLHKRPDAYLLGISTAGRGSKNILLRIIKAILRSPSAKVEQREYLTIARDEKRGQLLWMWQAPLRRDENGKPLEAIDDLAVIRKVNPAPWIDPRDIVKQLYDEGVGEAEFRRLARNEWVSVKSQWLPDGAWEELADPERGWPPARTPIVLGFDGSYNNDSTALVGWVVGKDYGFVVDAWERPDDDDAWIVPRDEVKAAVDDAMERWDVQALVADPPGWVDEIKEWSRKYGETLTIMFSTNQVKLMAEACREFYAGVVQKQIRHDGDPRLARHLANAFVKYVGRNAYITKEYPDSPDKIDLAVAAVVARWYSKRAKKKSKRVVSWGEGAARKRRRRARR